MTLQHPLKSKVITKLISSEIKEMNSPKEFKIFAISREDERPGRLLKLQFEPMQLRQTIKEFYDNLLCLYDSFKLRSYDPDYIVLANKPKAV